MPGCFAAPLLGLGRPPALIPCCPIQSACPLLIAAEEVAARVDGIIQGTMDLANRLQVGAGSVLLIVLLYLICPGRSSHLKSCPYLPAPSYPSLDSFLSLVPLFGFMHITSCIATRTTKRR